MKVVVLSERLGILDFLGPFRIEDDRLIDDKTKGFTYLQKGARYFFSNKSYESIPINSFKEYNYPKIHTF